MASTNTNCITGSSYFLKNHLPSIGKQNTIRRLIRTTFTKSKSQYMLSDVPLYIPLITARMMRASVTVMTVPPIVMFTLLCLASPYLLTIG